MIMIGNIKGHIKSHYEKLRLSHKVILAGTFILGTMFSLFSSLFASNLPFEDTLPTMFPGLNTGNYSAAHFAYGGNNYAGVIFWLTGETVSPGQYITIDGFQAITCTKKLKGLYYNNMRGWRIWPLDTGSLATLASQGSGYNLLTMSGGFYTNCSDSGGYSSVATNQVYGQITHVRSGLTLNMIAGVDYIFASNSMNPGGGFSGSLFTSGGVYNGRIWDSYGGIAQISSGQAGALEYCGNGIVEGVELCDDGDVDNNDICANDCTRGLTGGMCQGFTGSLGLINTGSNISFTCTGASITGYNLTGYILTIFSGATSVYTAQVFTSVNHYTRTTGSALPVGTYIAACTVLANTGVGPQCPPQIGFTVTGNIITENVVTGSCSSSFQGNLLPANAVFASGVSFYSATSGIHLDISATDPVAYIITGNFSPAMLTGVYTGSNYSNIISTSIVLNSLNAWNNIYSVFSTGSCDYIESTRRIFVDTLAPTPPAILGPLSGSAITGAGICSTGGTLFSWTASQDSGAGITSYHYIIQHASGVVYASGTTNGTTGVTIYTQNMLLGNYTWVVQAIDGVGNTSTSTTGSFSISPNYCPSSAYGSGIQIIGVLSSILNADLSTLYDSEIFYVRGLTGATPISISAGALSINGTMVGTTGIITSQDALTIELISSDRYDTKVSSVVSVAGITGVFNVTTKDNLCKLSKDEEDAIAHIYELMKDQYDSSASLISDFLGTFQSMLTDEIDMTEDCKLAYLLELIDADLDDLDVDTSNHIAPNCKEYQIGYNNDERAYYSPTMKITYYFINRETLIRHIDYYNPGDCHINTYTSASWSNNRETDTIHIAPNGKIYHLKGTYGNYTSTDFVGNKYFDSMEGMIMYIDSRNPAKEIWDHKVDRSFAVITYAAPNAKEYRIYKTDRGFMSYKLMKVKYYNSLTDLQNYINWNNPAKK